MDPVFLTDLLDQLNYIRVWTLRGGNDPEDEGSTRDAVDQLITAFSNYIGAVHGIPKPE